MILRTFRSNHPATLLLLPVLSLVLWFPAFFAPLSEVSPLGSPLFSFLQSITQNIPWLQVILGALLTAGGGMLLNDVLIRSEFQERSNYLPALTYVLFMSIFPEQRSFHPLLFGNIFLLFSLRRLFSIFRQLTVRSHAFDAGLHLGVASLFYFPMAFLLPYIWFSLMTFRSFDWREYFLPLLGIATPYTYLFVFLLWKEQLGAFTELLPTMVFQPFHTWSGIPFLNNALLIFFGLTMAVGLYHYLSSYGKSIMHNKKQKTILIVLFLLLLVEYGLSCYQEAPWRFAFWAVPLGAILPFHWSVSSWKWLGGAAFYLWLIAWGTLAWLHWGG